MNYLKCDTCNVGIVEKIFFLFLQKQMHISTHQRIVHFKYSIGLVNVYNK